MEYEWASDKAEANLAKHGVAFDAIHEFEWETAIIEPHVVDHELRFRATGYVGPRLHVVIFTMRGMTYRIISIRAGGRRDERNYAAT